MEENKKLNCPPKGILYSAGLSFLFILGLYVSNQFQLWYALGSDLTYLRVPSAFNSWIHEDTADGNKRVYVYLEPRDAASVYYAQLAKSNEPVIAEIVFDITSRDDIEPMLEEIKQIGILLAGGNMPAKDVRFIRRNDLGRYKNGLGDHISSHGSFGMTGYSPFATLMMPLICVLFLLVSFNVSEGRKAVLKHCAGLSFCLFMGMGTPFLWADLHNNQKFRMLYVEQSIQHIRIDDLYGEVRP